jgi:CubicO group peptidase (beta-lactamase class C family)
MRYGRTAVSALVAAAALTACSGSDGGGKGGRETESGGAECRTTAASPRYRAPIAAGRRLLPRLAAGLRAPGLSLAVAVDGSVVWSVNCGFANLRDRTPVTDGTLFRIGSVSKTLTATTLAHYVSAGRVDLDAAITRYVPSFRGGNGVTLRRLAGHLAGIRHYETRAEVVNRRRFAHVRDALAIIEGDALVAPPGAQFAYSTYGYNLIGAALERATRREFAALVREAVLTPAHLEHTLPGTMGVNGASTFYELTDTGGVRLAPPIDLSDRVPGGGYLSTARDLAVFGSLLAEGRLVPRRLTRTLFTSQRTAAGELTGYGIGFEVRPSADGLFVGHTGAVDGGTSALLIHVRSGTTLALATNVGFATAAAPPPPPESTPDPPDLLLPFVRAGR